jgi:ferritin-like metal-binding protein YciE
MYCFAEAEGLSRRSFIGTVARHGTLIAWARLLGRADCVSLLEQTLNEEKATDQKLSMMAQNRINRMAA